MCVCDVLAAAAAAGPLLTYYYAGAPHAESVASPRTTNNIFYTKKNHKLGPCVCECVRVMMRSFCATAAAAAIQFVGFCVASTKSLAQLSVLKINCVIAATEKSKELNFNKHTSQL